ncbi:Uncharacterised protein [uncultured archaeon]|nr:Uncharacterised protein [uncultured archaeon]
MQIKTKKQNADGIVRLETSGEIKEILIKEDILKPEETKIHLCFRGKNSSGIIELSKEEIDSIYKQVTPKMKMLGNIKVMRFAK